MTNDELKAVVKKNPIGVGCGVIIVGLLLSMYFRSDLKSEADALLLEKTAEGERYAANIKYSAQLEEDFARVSAANAEIASRAVQINQLGINSQFFYKLEGETGVKLIDFRQTTQSPAKTTKGAYQPVGFSVSAQGTLREVLHLIRLLESGTHYCRVLTASIVKAPNAGRADALTLSLSLELLGTP